MEGINYKVFVSGHRDLSKEEFDTIYVSPINQYIDWLNLDQSSFFSSKKLTFYVGDCDGCDNMVINYIVNNILPNNKNAYLNICTCDFDFDGKCSYNFDDPNISIISGFKTHEERDTYMTIETHVDLLYIRPNKWDSGTAQNFVRRVWLPKEQKKF